MGDRPRVGATITWLGGDEWKTRKNDTFVSDSTCATDVKVLLMLLDLLFGSIMKSAPRSSYVTQFPADQQEFTVSFSLVNRSSFSERKLQKKDCMGYVVLQTSITKQIWPQVANEIARSMNLIRKTLLLLHMKYLINRYNFMVFDFLFINNNSCNKKPVHHLWRTKKFIIQKGIIILR